MSLAPGGGVKLVEGGDVGGPGHVEALGVVIDRVCALQPHDGMLLAGQSARILTAEHVLHKKTALRPASNSSVAACLCTGTGYAGIKSRPILNMKLHSVSATACQRHVLVCLSRMRRKFSLLQHVRRGPHCLMSLHR